MNLTTCPECGARMLLSHDGRCANCKVYVGDREAGSPQPNDAAAHASPTQATTRSPGGRPSGRRRAPWLAACLLVVAVVFVGAANGLKKNPLYVSVGGAADGNLYGKEVHDEEEYLEIMKMWDQIGAIGYSSPDGKTKLAGNYERGQQNLWWRKAKLAALYGGALVSVVLGAACLVGLARTAQQGHAAGGPQAARG